MTAKAVDIEFQKDLQVYSQCGMNCNYESSCGIWGVNLPPFWNQELLYI